MLQGKPAAEYKGVAKFLTYLSSTPSAGQVAPGDGLRADHHWPPHEVTREGGLLQEDSRAATSPVKELTLKPPTANSKGLRIGNFVQIRDVIDEELESVWSGKKDAKAALDEAVKRGNELLKRFEAANK